MPQLIVGDVHGDLERLFQALAPYPPAEWETLFLGDLVDGGAFGAGALRYARDRPRSELLLGNHEVAMLWALRDPGRLPYWMGIGGQPHDLAELRKHGDLVEWLRGRPLLKLLPDGTLAQHTDTDAYGRLGSSIAEINASALRLLTSGGEADLNDILSAGGVFRRSAERLEVWLETHRARRLIHGHTPHAGSRPDVYAGGRAINFDGRFSRFYGPRYGRGRGAAATVGPLPPLVD